MYDLVVKGGKVIDPSQGLNDVRDVAIRGNQIAAIEKEIPAAECGRVIDAKDKIVTPGLIDLHSHVYEHVVPIGISPDIVGVKAGVTTLVDAGSSGFATFRGFRQFIMALARTNVYSFLHLSPTGLCLAPEIGHLDGIDVERSIRAVEENRDVIKGIKIRDAGPLGPEDRVEMFKRAKKVAKETRIPLMVHIGNRRAASEPGNMTREILRILEEGDILTHMYTPWAGRVIGENGSVLPELLEARDRGVIFDAARGKDNIGFSVAKMGIEQGIIPTTISSDVTSLNYTGPVYNLPTVMSQYMAFGLNLEQVIRMATVNSAKAIGLEDHLGSLKIGRQADVSIFQMARGTYCFLDSVGDTLPGQEALVPVTTIKSGQEIIAEPTFRG